MSSCVWAEDDFDLPDGVCHLQAATTPQSDRSYVMYHGTTRQSAHSILRSGFRPSSGGMLGPGVYLSRDLQKASRYPINHPEHDRVVVKVRVNVGRVIRIDYQGHPLQYTWEKNGFDTAWVPPNCGMVKSGLEENCVFDPKRIKVLKLISPQQTPSKTGDGVLRPAYMLIGLVLVVMLILFSNQD